MWQQYRKTALKTQLFICFALVAMYVGAHIPLIGILVCALAMELGAVIGAAWAVRLKRKIDMRYPLNKLAL